VGALQPDGKIIVGTSVNLLTSPAGPVLGLTRFNSDGSLDASFGSGGQILGQGLLFDSVHGITVQPDGKIVAVGSTFVPGANPGRDFAVARVNADGSPDTGFGTGGEVTTLLAGNSAETDVANAVAIQPDGLLVVAGSQVIPQGIDPSQHASFNFVAVRYTASGALDPTFASGGKFTTSFDGTVDAATAVVLQADHKIVLAGPTGNFGSQSFSLLRLNPDGSLDTSFNGTGKQSTELGTDSAATGVAVLKTGQLVVVGSVSSDTGHLFGLAAYNPDGSLDAGFGTAGTTTTTFVGPLSSEIKSVFVVAGGKILAVGNASNGVLQNVALARYDARGNLDPTFGMGGQVLTHFAGEFDRANSAVLQADGKILAVGSVLNGVLLVRYNPDGSLDTSFGKDGHVTTTNSLSFGANSGEAAGLQADGKILVAENGFVGHNLFATLARYNSDGSLDNTFVSGLFLNTVHTLKIQPDGTFLAAGSAHEVTAFAGAELSLARLNPDGTAAAGFGMQGLASLQFAVTTGGDGMDAALQSDGRVVAVGTILMGTGGVLLGRFQADGTPDPSFGEGGQVTLQLGAGVNSGNALLLQPNGLIVVGASVPSNNGDFALAVLFPDGGLDANFGRGGQVTTDFAGEADAINALALQPDGNIVAAGYASANDNRYFALARYLGDTTTPVVLVEDNARFVAGANHDLLGRTVDSGGLASFQPTLDTFRGQGLGPVATAYVTSAENRGNVISQDYRTYLGRAVSPAEVNGWLAAFQGGATQEQALAAIVGSGEYFQRAGGTNSGWLDQVYHDLLGRPRDTGSQPFLDALNGGTPRSTVVAAIQASQEYEMRLVSNTYSTFLGRSAGPDEAKLWFGLLSATPVAGTPSPIEQFDIAILTSGEYFQKHGNSTQGWVDSLYRTLLGRPPDTGGYDGALLGVLNSYAALRQGVAAALVGSSEYQTNLVAGYYTHFLKRAGSADEIAGWVRQLQAGATDEQVIGAIVSSGEYFQRASGNNASWLNQIYQDLLGRSRDPNDLGFLNALNGGASRAQVVAAILVSQEYQQRLVQSMYTDYLGRQASTADLSIWLPILAQGTHDEVVRAGLLASAEYFLRPHAYP
jgi:uncharacterized delta-60 repeat protein